MDAILSAKDFLAASGIVTDSAESLAKAVVAKLTEAEQVEISLSGMTGISSSYFNIVLIAVRNIYGVPGLDRVHIASPSTILRQIFERSRQAARRQPVA